MPEPIFHDVARLLLVVHAVVGFALVGSATHLAVYLVGLWRGREAWRRHSRLFGLLVPIIAVTQFLLGLVLYPSYRVDVRLAFLDARAPQLVDLFEWKEHSAALAIPVVLVACLLARRPSAQAARGIAAAFGVLGAALVWFAAIVGLSVTSFRAVGALP